MAEILVNPQSAPLDTTLDILVVGLPPGDKVTVRVNTGDRASHAVFEADERGCVDLTRHAPLEGSYHGVDPMGLFWSLEHTGGQPGPTVLSVDEVGEVELRRQTVPDGVRRTEVTENGLVGVLFEPDDDESYPGVIVLSGSEGGLHELDAALLAKHGFAALALAHFGARGVPECLVDIPLEYFGTAIEYLKDHSSGDIGVTGASRGGELALLIGSYYPDVRAVVSVVGSGVVTQGIGPGANLIQKLQHECASWTWQGEPLPYLPYYVSDELREHVVNDEPVPLALAFDTSDGIPDACEIPVERIVGGVLLISSALDEGWPSEELSEVAETRLAAHGHPFRYEHVVYTEAGHLIAGPPHRSAVDLHGPGPGVTFSYGGTPEANAAARADAWKRTVEFFTEQLAN